MGKATIYKSPSGKKVILTHYEEYLESLAFEVERVYVNTNYGRTHVLIAGPTDGKPLFIFQGGNCINPMTLSWFSSLADTYRIYAPDTIGHPGYSEERRMSAKDQSFAKWIRELMDYFGVEHSAFVGPSYGGGIILRLAAFMPDKIDCAVLVSPAGIKLGSKVKMIQEILIPMVLFNRTSSKKYLTKITDAMSDHSMKEMDREIIGDVFKHVKLEQDMPKLTTRKELENYRTPTLVITGQKDVFFPAERLDRAAREIIPNLTALKTYDMGHFPSEGHLVKINNEMKSFLEKNYK
jgi:pimeloyl-ACP methyl ester carboxylesterase